MQIEGLIPNAANGTEADAIRAMIAESSKQARLMTQQKLAMTQETERAIMREQIESLSFNSERAMSNELANRTLSRMFGSFTLIQKIMQNMG